MRTLTEILAGLAILVNAVICGTDVFGAIILRPAIAAAGDRSLTQLPGHVHRIAGRRYRAPGEHRSRGPRHARPDHLPSDLHPDQQALEHGTDRSALAGQVPGNARQLQARSDSVINARAALQALALAAA